MSSNMTEAGGKASSMEREACSPTTLSRYLLQCITTIPRPLSNLANGEVSFESQLIVDWQTKTFIKLLQDFIVVDITLLFGQTY